MSKWTKYQFWPILTNLGSFSNTFGLILRTRSRFFQFFFTKCIFLSFYAKIIQIIYVISVKIGIILNFSFFYPIFAKFGPKTHYLMNFAFENYFFFIVFERPYFNGHFGPVLTKCLSLALNSFLFRIIEAYPQTNLFLSVE